MRSRIGLLGMPDNLSTRVVITELARLGRPVDVVFLQQPDSKTQWRRVVRKLRSAGLAATVGRVLFALRSRLTRSAGPNPAAELVPWPERMHRIGDVNAPETRQIIGGEQLDLLLISTDSMIGRGTFSLPRLGTLNAHPGWIPQYRGLGSLPRMFRDGIAPAISVHLVDEGVDTGPLILRESVDLALAGSGANADLACHREQARMFAKAVELLESGQARPIDTFLEPSSMARGLQAAEVASIMQGIKGGEQYLVPMERRLAEAPTDLSWSLSLRDEESRA